MLPKLPAILVLALAGTLTRFAPPGFAQPVLVRPNPLHVAWLTVPDPTKTRMRSGFDYHDGNYDSGNLIRVEPAGASFSNAQSAWVLFEADGPGALTSVWMTGKNKQGQAWIGGWLNFHFDGEAEPTLSGELPALLESGAVFPRALAEKSSGGWVCYAPIHFARSLKITLTRHDDAFGHRKNGRGETIPHVYHQFTWQRLNQAVKSSRAEDLRRTPLWEVDRRGERVTRELPLPTGEGVTVFAARGPGILNALRLRFQEIEPDLCRLRVRADGTPQVDLSVPEFWGFARRQRPQARFQSLLLGVDDSGGYYSFWPMPHRASLQVELETSGAPGRVEIETVHLSQWPEKEHLHFHAERVTDTTVRGRDIKLLEVQGRGHFAGCLLALADQTLEGDDRFFVDGEPFPPSWHGTGTEDYFRCGWYFHGGPLTRPLYGLLDGARPKLAYRFHLADRVNFTQSLVVGFEHGHRNDYLGPYRGVVFWYGERTAQIEPRPR